MNTKTILIQMIENSLCTIHEHAIAPPQVGELVQFLLNLLAETNYLGTAKLKPAD